jgi:Flp pilus assembly protein CpaB
MLTKVGDAVGRPALTSLFKDEPVLDAKLGARGTGGGLASLLKHGMRAVTIPTTNGSQTNHIATFIEVGSHVDIHWTPPETGRDPNASAAENIPLLENVEVIAVDDKLDSTGAAKAEGTTIKSVTVQLKPEDAATLAPALTRGAIHLSMRNPTDEGRAPRRPVVAKPPPRREVAEAPKPAPAPALPIPVTIRTLRGTREGVIHLAPAGGSQPAALAPAASPATAVPPAPSVTELGREAMKRFSPFGAPSAAAAK